MIGRPKQKVCNRYRTTVKRLQTYCNLNKYPAGHPKCARARDALETAYNHNCGWAENLRWWKMVRL